MLHLRKPRASEVRVVSKFWSTSRLGRAFGRAMVGAALLVTSGCGGDEKPGGTAGGDAGEVAALDYEVTPDRYQRWVAAQQTLDALPGLPAPPKIDPMRLGDAEIRRAVEYLEGNTRARGALARAGISARDYVLTTVALDQALVTASSVGAARAASPSPGTAGGRVTSAPASGTVASSRPRLSGTPPGNVELVRRNRDDVVRVLRTMRFRVSESIADDVGDTTVQRTDSVMVGKDITVKWDVTVRRNRDTAKARPRSGSVSDSTRRDSTDRKGSPR